MRKLFSITLIGVLSLSVAFSAMQKKVANNKRHEINNQKHTRAIGQIN